MVSARTKPHVLRVKITTAQQIPVPITSEQAHVVHRKGVHGTELLVVRAAKLPQTDNAVLRAQLITRGQGVVQVKTLLPAAAPQSKVRLTNFGRVINV